MCTFTGRRRRSCKVLCFIPIFLLFFAKPETCTNRWFRCKEERDDGDDKPAEHGPDNSTRTLWLVHAPRRPTAAGSPARTRPTRTNARVCGASTDRDNNNREDDFK